MKPIVIIEIVAAVVILGGGGAYLMFKPKDVVLDANGNVVTGTPAGDAPKAGLGTQLLNLGVNNAGGIFGAASNLLGGGGSANGELIADVAYIASGNNNGVITDPSIMEIRFNKDDANVKVGDSITLTGAGAAYDGTYPVISVWGEDYNAKTAMVRKTTGLPAAGMQTPNAKAYMASSSFDGVKKSNVSKIF